MRAAPVLCFLIAALMALVAPRPLLAQTAQGIAAIVNDEVVSQQDVENRTNLFIVTSNLENQPDVRKRLNSGGAAQPDHRCGETPGSTPSEYRRDPRGG